MIGNHGYDGMRRYIIIAYSDFNLNQVKAQFNLTEKTIDMLPISASDWLTEILAIGYNLIMTSSSEKARSELLVNPVLLELRRRNANAFAIYSGINLDIDNSHEALLFQESTYLCSGTCYTC